MATSKKTAPKKTAAAAPKAAPRANPVQDIQEAMAKPFKGVTERLQALNIPGIAERFKEMNVQGAAGALLDNGRKDLKALVEANEKSYKGLQAVVARQTEMLKSSISDWQGAVQGMPGKDPKENLAKLDEMARASFKRALDDMKELADLAAKSQADAFNVVRERINDNVEQVSKLLKRGGK
ncbi:TIGR01841 family phasin [Variovorax sp. J22G21]|uniref:phasin family protein n=1 Tax=Variovorax fucosicus TaxID=3053517 RepID=UPI002578A76B|nr:MULTISPECIES: TIGR01841 family phasin [unclassified Variovorax]MDM0039225.1 TIGR01841 family phasin [Variovorax sp. J22R193]MDM0055171.1 TIGR01841 family phasin [Variovorax sp. J22G47]MDM0064001.1 TIGR01841 family phasin [Variovorax sp. J22G21]